MGQPSELDEQSASDELAPGRLDPSYVRLSHASPSIPGPARIPIEALSLPTKSGPMEIGSDSGGLSADVHKSNSSLPPPIARFAEYDVLGRIAVGGMAEIYLGREVVQAGALRHLAIKVLRRHAVARDDAYFEELFLREGRTAAQLVHPNICHSHAFGKWGGHYYIAMEWVDGVSLREVLRSLVQQQRPLDPLLAVSIAAQVAGALDYAHNARDARRRPMQIVHRDVNPQNIMLRHDGVVKLLDFGVAHVAEPNQDSRSDTVKGKFAYMAPEQARQEPIDGRADVFALGVCLHEMLTGTRLYGRDNMRDTVEALLTEAAPPMSSINPSVSRELDDIVQRALAKDPGERFASASDLQAALETHLAESGKVVSARHLAALMHSLYPDARNKGPSLFVGAEVAERLAPIAGASAQPLVASDQGSMLPTRRLPMRAVAAVLVGLLMASLAWAWSGREPEPKLVTSEPPKVEAPAAVLAPEPEPVQAAPALLPVAPTTPATASKRRPTGAAKPEENLVKRRPRSPGFVATPGF
jgi:eukaryotic-like serine/threonine-protein kinase